MRIGHSQVDSQLGNFEGNLARVVAGLERAERERVEIVSFPEWSASWRCDKNFLNDSDRSSQLSDRVRKLKNSPAAAMSHPGVARTAADLPPDERPT